MAVSFPQSLNRRGSNCRSVSSHTATSWELGPKKVVGTQVWGISQASSPGVQPKSCRSKSARFKPGTSRSRYIRATTASGSLIWKFSSSPTMTPKDSPAATNSARRSGRGSSTATSGVCPRSIFREESTDLRTSH